MFASESLEREHVVIHIEGTSKILIKMIVKKCFKK